MPRLCGNIAMSDGEEERPRIPTRDRLRAIEVLGAMTKLNIDAAVALDRINRLDEGLPTEILQSEVQAIVATLSQDEAGREALKLVAKRSRLSPRATKPSDNGNGELP